ncbi:MAG: hypothetical protein ACREFZ_07800 [Acetobacteraceae bacterium]
MHNLHHYLTLMRELREAIAAGRLEGYVADFHARREADSRAPAVRPRSPG